MDKKPHFWRSIRSIEEEIVYQILFAELAFDICRAVPIISGRGNDLLPYFYNLNFCKGVIVLHGLLLSNHSDEITIKNYIKQYKWEYKIELGEDLKKEIQSIRNEFQQIYEHSLRNKIAAHISQDFKHTDFTSAYIMPRTLETLSYVVNEIKQSLFKEFNYSVTEDPLCEIKEQSYRLIKSLK